MINDNLYGLVHLVVAPAHGDSGPITITDLEMTRFFLTLEEAIHNLRGKGSKSPSRAVEAHGYFGIDSPQIASIAHADLKAHSEKIKAEIAERLKKAEEERIRLEEEKKAANSQRFKDSLQKIQTILPIKKN